ncbi:MAG: radical SAM protein [Oliverpabstia sp.]
MNNTIKKGTTMLNRFVVRKEAFGGIIYDTEQFCFYAIDNEGIGILKEMNFSGLNEAKRKYANDQEILSYIDNLETIGFNSEVCSELKIIQNPIVSNSLTAPVKAYLTVTDRCNLRCKHCFGTFGVGHEMSLEQVEHVLNQLEEVGVCEIGLTGGEPFYHPDIYTIITMIVDRGFTLQTTTNGTLINQEFIDIFKKYGKKCFRLSISFDGIPDFHDSIRGQGSFERAISGARLLKENGIEFAFNTVINACNINSLNDFLQIMFNEGIYSGSFNIIQPVGRAKNNANLLLSSDPATMCQQIHFVKTCIHRFAEMTGRSQYMYGRSIQPDGTETYGDMGFLAEIGLKGCGAGANIVTICSDGRLLPCIFIEEFLTEKGMQFDSIFDKPLLEIWRTSTPFTYMRNRDVDSQCKKCEFYQKQCTSVCPAMAMYYYGNPNTPMPYCQYNVPRYLNKCACVER